MQNVGVVFLQQRRDKAEDQTARRVDERVAEIIPEFHSAGPRDVALFHSLLPTVSFHDSVYHLPTGIATIRDRIFVLRKNHRKIGKDDNHVLRGRRYRMYNRERKGMKEAVR